MYFLYDCQRRAGEVASGLALEVLSEEMESPAPTCPKRNLFRAAVEKVNARVWKQSDGRPGHAPRPAERKADVSSLGLHECDSTLRRRLSHPVARRDAFFWRDLAPPFRTLSNLTCKVNPIIIA